LNRKLTLLVVVLWAGLLMIGGFGAMHGRSQMLASRHEQLRQLVQEATSIATWYHDLSEQKIMSDADARKQALIVMSKLRFGSDGYVTVSDSHLFSVMPPIRPELNGRDMSGFVDAVGNHIYADVARAGNQPGGGLFTYAWVRPGGRTPIPKTGFSMHFEPWDWYISIGMYTDDIERQFRDDLLRWFAITLLLGGAATGIMAVVLRSVRKSLGGELEAALGHAQRMARGDLTGIMPDGQGEHGSLIGALREMQVKLVDMIGRVRAGAENVSIGADEIAAGNADLSQRTEEQAAALVETVSSMEQMTSSVRQNADGAQHAAQLATQAASIAAKGSEIVIEVVTTMEQISDSSRKIADILSLIDGIAFQTNILALNAAVEAARAGDQGRGFAVVAAEVRSLAQRSALAAKEITGLIGASAETVGRGAVLVNSAGETMTEILGAAQHVASILDMISTASREQTAGIEQVNRAVGEMDHVAQHNAALVEQAASAASSLRDQASALRGTISSFVLPAKHG
jgi:methyl-accepting chemotaxis protein